VKEGRVRQNETAQVSGWLAAPYQAYSAMQRLLVGSHEDVVAALGARSSGAMIGEEERQRYRKSFRPLVRGWNLMGDNMRRYVVGLLVCIQRIDLLFAFIVIPLNLVFIAMRIRQARADRRFLAAA
jgi:hypothetical protein